MDPPYMVPLDRLLATLGSSRKGIDEETAAKRLKTDGPNLLQAKKKEGPVIKFLKQFTNSLIIILMITGVICFLLGDHFTDGIVIFVVIFLNAIMGFVQEHRAEKAIYALKRLSASEASVIRGGKSRKVSAADLVKGDIIMLMPGSKVPADCRLVEAEDLEIDESILTGESNPVTKLVQDQPKEVPLAERLNMVYMGTMAMAGEGKGVVVETGMGTEIGKITKLVIEEEQTETPLTKQLNSLGKVLAFMAVIIGAALFLMSWYNYDFSTRFKDLVVPLLTGISVMVAVVPEGLPVVVALTLTIGMQIMARKNAIVRKLTGVETLGSTTYICTDKTGTLTKNEMTVKRIFLGGKRFKVGGEGYNRQGAISADGEEVEVQSDENLEMMLTIAMLCNDARPVGKEGGEVIGSPTDRALYYAALKGGMKRGNLLERYPQIEKLPFTSERKLMITFHETPDGEHVLVLIKGAPEYIVDLCSTVIMDGREVPLGKELMKRLTEENLELGLKSYRNIAMAYSKVRFEDLSMPRKEDLKDLRGFLRRTIKFTFMGMFSLWDPPRPEVKGAIATCRSAGIKVVMITGDHTATALAIGEKIGLYKEGDMYLTGAQLDAMSETEFESVVEKVRIYSRTTPQHKMRIVDALKKKGEVVAMTGDGVNDAPALAKADIGVAMGQTGSDVAKDASTIILTDDNFATIVGAVEEGRKIYSNIKRFVRYQISTNVGAILLIMLSLLMKLPIPLLPVQILWINILIDGPPAIALGMEPVTQNVMKNPPRPRKERILKPETIISILMLGAVMAIGTILVFYWARETYGDNGDGLEAARSIAFTTFVVFQLYNVLNCKSETETLLSKNIVSNKFILIAIGICFLLQLVLLYVPLFQSLFHTVPLRIADWALIIIVCEMIILVEEVSKHFRRNPLF